MGGCCIWPLPVYPPPAPPAAPVVAPAPAPTVALSPTTGTFGYSNSQYGDMIPIIFGNDRVTGNVIWAGPMTNIATTINGVPTTYDVVSFAVALCEGPINGVVKIWAGDRLALDNSIQVDSGSVVVPPPTGTIGSYTTDFTDPAGAFATLDPSSRGRATKVTIFNGDEYQVAQGIMVAQEGYEATPAYRGCAYVLFEDFPIESGNLPALFFEVISNTDRNSPRQYTDFVASTFDTWKYSTLQYDPSYDRFYAFAQKTSPAAHGLEVIDGNSMTELAQYAIQEDFGIGPDWNTLVVCRQTGILIVTAQSGNEGIVYSLNPFAGTLLYTLGPGGSLTGHGVPGNGLDLGFANIALGTGVATFVCPVVHNAAQTQDVFCAVGQLNRSVALASVADNGLLTMLSTKNSALPSSNNAICALDMDTNSYGALTAARKFYDGYVSLGQHIYGFSWDTNEAVSIKVWRLTAASATIDPTDPVYIQLASIPVDMFAGTGYTYAVRAVQVDRSDMRIVLLIQGSAGTWLCKYDPYTGHVLWVTLTTGFPDSIESETGPDWALLYGKYAWIDGSNAVWRINLADGVMTSVMSALSTESLPNRSNAKQFYNGAENTITYMTATATKHVTKIFVDRVARESIDLSEIVDNLIERTGLLASDIDVDDLSELTLMGYTVSQIQSISQCLTELGQAFTFDVVETNGHIRFKTRGNGIDATIDHSVIQAGSGAGNGNDNPWLITHQANDGTRLRKINLTYKDIDRDFAQNVQSIILNRYGTQVFDPEAAIDVTVPLVMTADQAKALAEILLYAKLTYNTTYEFGLSPANIILDAADVVTITMPAGEDNITVRLRDVTIDTNNFVSVQASEENTDIYTDQIAVFSNLGRFNSRIIPQPPPRIDVLFLAIPGRRNDEIGVSTTTHRLFLTLLNTRQTADVLTTFLPVTVDGVNYSVSPTAGYPTWGYVVTPPQHTKSTAAWDFGSSVVVDIYNDNGFATLASATMDDLLESDTVNLCYIAGELFQFVTATQLSTTPNRWRLETLARGKMGTDPRCQSAAIGDKFVLLAGNDGIIDGFSTSPFDVPHGATPNHNISVAIPTGNPFQPKFGMTVKALNLAPFRVAAFDMAYVSTDVVMSWQRRDRTGDGAYPDDGSVPPSEGVDNPESSETYVLYLYTNPATFDVSTPASYLRKVTATTNAFTYTAAMQTADSFVRATTKLYVQIQQTGSLSGVDDGDTEVHQLPHA